MSRTPFRRRLFSTPQRKDDPPVAAFSDHSDRPPESGGGIILLGARSMNSYIMRRFRIHPKFTSCQGRLLSGLSVARFGLFFFSFWRRRSDTFGGRGPQGGALLTLLARMTTDEMPGMNV